MTISNLLPPLRPLYTALSSQDTLMHVVTPTSIDVPVTTLLATRPCLPLRRCDVPSCLILLCPVFLIPSLTPTSTYCRTALQSLIRLIPRCDLPDLPRPTV